MMPLLAQSKTDEKKLLERIDYMIDNDKHYQDIKENELKQLKQLEPLMQKMTRPDFFSLTAYTVPTAPTATTRHTLTCSVDWSWQRRSTIPII